MTPGTFSAATRNASRSCSSRITPSSSTTPSIDRDRQPGARRPIDFVEFGQDLLADGVITAGGDLRRVERAGKRREQVDAADHAEQRAVLDHRDPLDAAALHHFHDLVERRVRVTETISRDISSSQTRPWVLT